MRENIFMKPNHISLKKIKNTIKLFDRTLNSKLDPVAVKAFCSGYILSMATYTDISQEAVSELNTYIKIKSKV